MREVLATSALKATNGFTAPLPIVLTIIGYAIALFFLGLTFKSIPMGLAYALWSGAGIILISTVGWIYFKTAARLCRGCWFKFYDYRHRDYSCVF